MDLNHVRTFAHVAQAGSFAEAARALGVDRTRVSRVIGDLERALGVRLFVRTTRRVRPTVEGEALARQVAAPLGQLEAALAATPAARSIASGTVTLTTTPELARALVAPLLPGFRARYPAVQVALELSDELVPFTRGVDLALRLGRPGGAGLVARKLRALTAGFFASPGYLARRGTPRTAADFAAHELMWPVVRGHKSFAPATRPRPPAIACADFGTLAELACAGAGIALLPTFVAARPVARGELVRVVPEYALASAPLYLVSAPPAQLPARVRALRDLLLAELPTA